MIMANFTQNIQPSATLLIVSNQLEYIRQFVTTQIHLYPWQHVRQHLQN